MCEGGEGNMRTLREREGKGKFNKEEPRKRREEL